ncbi:MAG: NADH-quinone oxidoreductase subunit N [Planctomycetes bacterium]|nr:NADH-quinone oxidoreductase subunit N [Planctomycetota bacterium]
MSGRDVVSLLPMLMVAGGAVATMLVAGFWRRHRLAQRVTVVGLALGFVSVLWIDSETPRHVTTLLVIDRFALLFMGLLTAASFTIAVLSTGYWDRKGGRVEEFYVLLQVAALGGMVLAASRHLVSFFLGLELLTVPLYPLIAYSRAEDRSIEAGVKYLVLAAGSAAILLFGMALLYAEAGTLEFGRLGGGLAPAGLALILVGVGFKLGVAPFHLWVPDVYEGAPAPVTALIATVSKGAMFAVLLRFLQMTGMTPSLEAALGVIAIASMALGNVSALLQDNVKRLLGYSSIAHLGYLLVALLAGGIDVAAYYLLAYFATVLGAFGVVMALSGRDRDADDLADYRGLYWRQPGAALVLVASFLSLAGLPITGGFLAKVFVVVSGLRSGLWMLVAALAVTSAVGVFYYLRVIVTVFRKVEEAPPSPRLSRAAGAVLGIVMGLLVWLGVWPEPFQRIMVSAAGALR